MKNIYRCWWFVSSGSSCFSTWCSLYNIFLKRLSSSFGYVQHVNEPTHVAGHTLDLVITNRNTGITDLKISDPISDHSLIYFRTCIKKPTADSQSVTRRAWRCLSHDAFASDASASRLSRLCGDLTLMSDMSADDLAQIYRDAMTDLIGRHCPTVTVRRRVKPSTPWFHSECRDTWRKTRAAERRHWRTQWKVFGHRDVASERARTTTSSREQLNFGHFTRCIDARLTISGGRRLLRATEVDARTASTLSWKKKLAKSSAV